MKIKSRTVNLNRNNTVVVIGVGAAFVFVAGMAINAILQPIDKVAAEQVGSSPESGVDSRIKEAYDFLVSKGDGYGDTASDDWSHNWGTMWSRIMASAAWTPEGDAATEDVANGKRFYSGSRGLQTGTYVHQNDLTEAYEGMELQNTPADTAGDGQWVQTSSGGEAVSVTLRETTITLSSNTVLQDQRTGIYWSDLSSSAVSNNDFANTSAQTDRVSPDGSHCNFNSPGDANSFCNQADVGVSANELCLNLSLDSNGDGTPETDWRLPTQKEMMVAFSNGSAANLPNANNHQWASSQSTSTLAWRINLSVGITNTANKTFAGYYARCVRGSG